jgi:hypothetical protein
MSDLRSAARRARSVARPLGIAATLLAGLALGRPAHAAAAADCKPADGARFICGVTNVEDWAQVHGTHWVIGSNLASPGTQGTFYLFDTRHETASAVEPAEIAIKPDKAKYPDCPGAPDWKIFGPHGLDITPASGDQRTLYAVNHGGREAVEVFEADFSKARPAFTWTGCLTAPKGAWPDAVASVPGGGLVVTSLWDPTDKDRLGKLSAGQPVGGLFEWSPGKGWSTVPGSEGLSGPNGVITTPDGKWIYVAVWAGKQITRLSRGEAKPQKDTVDAGFLVDNVRWSPDGSRVFAGGQATSVKEVLTCFESTDANCPNVPFTVVAVDPKTLKQTVLVKPGTYGGLGAGTGAIEVGHDLWVSTFRGDRIAIFPMK